MAGAVDGPAGRTGDALSWREFADAVWLGVATQRFWERQHRPRDAAGEPPPADRPPPTARPVPEPVTDPPPHPSTVDPVVPRTEPESRPPEPEITPVRGELRATATLPWTPADMIRALRPFKRRVPSPRPDEIELDEEETAERAAQSGVWLPITKPVQTRWLDLTLVVDMSPSMVLWRPTVRAFTAVVEQLGAFRSVHHCFLDATGEPVLRSGADTPAHGPGEVVDFSGRRIVLVLTDGVGAAWRQGRVAAMLAHWAAVMPVALVHMLPQRMWSRSRLGLRHADVLPPRPLAPNRGWQVTLDDAWVDPEQAAADTADAVPIPVFELMPRWMASCAALFTGARSRPAKAMVMLARTKSRPAVAEDEPVAPPSAHELVTRFLGRASPLSYRLATLLAAVPVNLDVARTVQAELVPESGPAHLAEVLDSGLLRPSGPDSWQTTSFEFASTAVREVLLSGARRTDTAHVVRTVAEHHSVLTSLAEIIGDPANAPEPTAEHPLDRTVLRALSGPYLRRAARLEESAVEDTRSSETRLNTKEVGLAGTQGGGRIGSVSTSASDTVPAAGPGDPVAVPPPADPSPRRTELAIVSAPHTPRADDVPTIWGDVPPRNPIFTGRDDLLGQLSRRLTAGGTTAILPAALHGMGGIGKTQIAAEYIYRHLEDYELVWWIQATQPAQIRAALTDLAQALRLPGAREAHTAVPAVREALRIGVPYRRWLLVFDSAESPEAVRPFFPSNGPGEILITSRNPDWAGVARPLEIAVFSRAESKELLRRRGPEIDDAQADALAQKLGDLPLAIAQAAAWRAETGMPVREYLRLFDEKVAEILDTTRPDDYEVPLAAAWNVSFDELQSRNPAAHQLLQVCAFFAPDPISRSLFTGVRGLSIAVELDAALRDPIRLGRAIRDINRYGLAKIDHRNDTLLLHRLVQLVLRDRMPPQRRADMKHGAHQLLANLDPNDPNTAGQWPRYQAILPHAYASDIVECDDRWVRQLVLNLMTFLYQWGDHEEAANLAKRATETWQNRLDETDPQLLQAWGQQAIYLWTLGRYGEASPINERTLALHRRVSGEDSEETLLAERRVAVDRRAKGDFSGALAVNRDVYQKAKGVFGDDDPVTLSAAHDLGVILRLVGEYTEARVLDEDMYKRQVELRGYDAAQTLNVLGGLILDRMELGEYGWASVEQERLAERAARLFGEDTAATLQRQHHLSMALRKNGDHAGALERSTQAWQRYRIRYGDSHPQTLACAIGQSINLRNAGELSAAQQLGEETFGRYRAVLGEHHPHTLAAAVDLAVTLRLMGDADAAQTLDERSLEQFRTMFGPDQPHAIGAAINLASDLAARGEFENALKLDNDVVARAERVLGADHPTTLAAAVNRTFDLRALGRGQEADPLYVDVMNRYRRVLGDKHPGVVAASTRTRANCDLDPLPL
ncbi:FxSxx-COOH system tetratricopeptide repeat protein [Kutzneria chonburiensis]|uniref:FxSxx-COOH system tetratricopeptide repeat protein n=1 Tax=Kutzneria chonburiensis TaxID=1483604 RepID=A0ABV6N7G9_9PSEU|nr:FxSxx-COOH system tetratricopeptide repeat protein [Kutzneria chonburiensis]